MVYPRTESQEATRRAVELADDLPPVADCADIELLTAPVKPPRNPEAREAVARVRESLARVRTARSRQLAES